MSIKKIIKYTILFPVFLFALGLVVGTKLYIYLEEDSPNPFLFAVFGLFFQLIWLVVIAYVIGVF